MKLKDIHSRGYYSVKLLSRSPSGVYAFAVSPSNFEIVLGRSGHGTILRGYDKRDFSEGGWVQLKTKKLIFNCGTLKDVKDKSGVKMALEDFFDTNFGYAR